MYVEIKRSHSIHMLSIQIDTKSLELVIYHQFNNIKLSLFASQMKSSFPLCMFIRYSRVVEKLQTKTNFSPSKSIELVP